MRAAGGADAAAQPPDQRAAQLCIAASPQVRVCHLRALVEMRCAVCNQAQEVLVLRGASWCHLVHMPCYGFLLPRSVLHLYDNPLDFLPEISPCSELTHLTVANLRITADQVRRGLGPTAGRPARRRLPSHHICAAMLPLTPNFCLLRPDHPCRPTPRWGQAGGCRRLRAAPARSPWHALQQGPVPAGCLPLLWPACTPPAPPLQFKVEFLPPPPGGGGGYSGISLWDSKQSDRLRPIFALMLRRSSGHHPLLAGALREWRAGRGGAAAATCVVPLA